MASPCVIFDDDIFSDDIFSGPSRNYITNEDKLIINQHFSNFGMVTIDKTGHWLHAEKPSYFVKTICKYLI